MQEPQVEQLAAVLEASGDLVVGTDVDGRLRWLNAAARTAFGLRSEDEVRSYSGLDAYAPASRDLLLTTGVPVAVREGRWTAELTLLLPGDRELPVRQTLLCHRGPDGRVCGFSSVTRDLSEHDSIRRQLVHRSLHDPLTGLPNRRLLLDRVERALEAGTTVAVLRLDLDRFHLVNEAYGLRGGDAVLMQASRRLRRLTQGGGETAARLDGAGFAVLAPVASEAEARRLAAHLRDVLRAPFRVVDELGEGDARLTVSAGIALGTAGNAAADVLRDAETALSRAKTGGPARTVVADAGLRADTAARRRTTDELQAALATGQLRLAYQPEVALATGHVVAVEALLRWDHPERGPVSPAEFVPLAETTGLMAEIGDRVLTGAVEQAARWYGAGLDLTVWVNLSAHQLGDEQLVDRVAALLATTGLPGARLGLEVTETAVLPDLDGAATVLGDLRGLGVRLAVDDFGTGYSSLSHLTRLPVDTVKVDRSFVAALDTSGAPGRAVVAGVVGMAAALGLDCVAEGVETRAQRDALRSLGCATGQGWWWSPALPPEDLERLLSADRAGQRWHGQGRAAVITLPRQATASC